MDDFNLSTLTESRNEYSALLVSKLTPCLIQGITSIFNEACELCIQNYEDEKYLMTFQNFLARVTKWNPEIIQKETERIMRECNCNYLEDLLTCVHVTQLKVLTNVRVGSKQKKVTIDIPKLDEFIHKCYIDVARKVYKNVFLFDKSVMPLMRQKNLRELELIVKECVLNVIRENMPIENILKSYLEEGVENTVDEEKTEIKEVQEPIEEIENSHNSQNITGDDTLTDNDNIQGHQGDVTNPNTNNVQEREANLENTLATQSNYDIASNSNVISHVDTIGNNTNQNGGLQFNDTDEVKSYNKDEVSGNVQKLPVISVDAPKDINRLEEISEMRNQQRKEEYDSDEDDDELLQIHDDNDENIKLDFEKINTNNIKLADADLLGDIEVLH